MTNITKASLEAIAAGGAELLAAEFERLAEFRKQVYRLAELTIKCIVDRYPEAREARGAAINVLLSVNSTDWLPIFGINLLHLADGRMQYAVSRTTISTTERTPVFVELPEEKGGKYNTIADQQCVGRLDTDRCEEPEWVVMAQFLDLVVAKLPEVLDHVEVWPAKN